MMDEVNKLDQIVEVDAVDWSVDRLSRDEVV